MLSIELTSFNWELELTMSEGKHDKETFNAVEKGVSLDRESQVTIRPCVRL